MAKKRKRILDDERYPDFVERYQTDPLRFAVECCGMEPSSDQEDLFRAMEPMDCKVSVVSGTGTGKTSAFGRLCLWSMLCHPYAIYEGKLEIGSNTYVGAPNLAQVADGVQKEIADARIAIGNGPHAWINQYYTITKTKVYVHGFEEQWFISRVALAKGQSVGIAGKHRYWQFIIIDEAGGVSDDHFDVIDGTQTQAGNRTLMASQGVRSSGRHHASHHKLSRKNGGSWHSLRFNSERSPFVTTKWLKDREKETGGRDSIEYQIRVLGLFPELTDKFLLGRAQIERCIGAKPVIQPGDAYGNFFIVDVGAGVYRDHTVGMHCRVFGNGDRIDPDARRVDVQDIPIYSNSLDWQEVAGRVVDYCRNISNVTIVVDVGGQGIEFARMLERLGCTNIIKVNWGKPCFKKKNRDRFFNQRAQCSVAVAEAAKDSRITFSTKIDERKRQQMIDEGSKIPFFFDEKARYHIMPKEQMKSLEGISSPDIWDTISMAYLDIAHYIVDDEFDAGANAALHGIDAAVAAAEDAFADA